MAQGAALEMSWAQLGTNWMNSAPKIAPEIGGEPADHDARPGA